MEMDVGRRVYLLLALPAPVLHNGALAPLRTPQALNAHDKEHNEHVQRWWRDREHVSLLVRKVQTATLLGAADTANPASLYRQLGEIAALVRTLAAVWEQVFYYAYTRGSWLRSAPEFVPTWQLLTPLSAFLAYEFGARIEPSAVRECTYSSPSIVFESICIAYLQLALEQQMATLAHVALRTDAREHGVLLPTSEQIVGTLRGARAVAKQIVEKVLPLHFELRDGSEPFLLTPHFYRQFVGRLLVAQQTYVQAMALHDACTPDSVLSAAALFAHSARSLIAARETAYANTELLGALAMHRRAAALMALASALHMCESQSALENLLAYERNGIVEMGEPNYQAMAVEAFYCAREALALMSTAVPMQTQYERIGERLTLMYNSILPPLPPSAALAPTTITELRTRRAAVVPGKDSVWRREFGNICIEAKFAEGEDTSDLCRARATALHQMPISSTLNIGGVRRHFVITCSCSVK